MADESANPPYGLRRDSSTLNIHDIIVVAKMRHPIHGKTLDAKKARILINALVDCAKAGLKPSFPINKMLWGISLYLESGSFTRENWRTYHRVSDAAKQVRGSGDKDWKRAVTFEHVRPLSKMYQMLLDERETLTLERAAFIIGEYPPVLVTMEEELRMTKLGFKHDGEPEQRYAEIPISGFSLRSDDAMLGWRSIDAAFRLHHVLRGAQGESQQFALLRSLARSALPLASTPPRE